MAKIEYSRIALLKLEEIEAHYLLIDRKLAKRVLDAIFKAMLTVAGRPKIGRPQITFPDHAEPELREWVIPFGESGFLALYREDAYAGKIIVLAIRHQRELDFGKVEL